jgi:hypothetical protein
MSKIPSGISPVNLENCKQNVKNGYILDPDRTQEQKEKRIIREISGGAYHNGKYSRRGTKQHAVRYLAVIIGNKIITQHIGNASDDPTQNIQVDQFIISQQVMNDLSEPVKEKHVEKNMKKTLMKEKICNKRPWLDQKTGKI